MASKSILIILSYTVSKLVRFFETQCSFLAVNFDPKFEREHRERGRQMREGWEK